MLKVGFQRNTSSTQVSPCCPLPPPPPLQGLTACVVVSNWTWAATLLQSSNVAYKFGVSGPFWYAAGATIQVLLFAILAVEIKRKTPMVHTFPEIIRYRWGKVAHIVYMIYGFITNFRRQEEASCTEGRFGNLCGVFG